jgi:hypothetical protein
MELLFMNEHKISNPIDRYEIKLGCIGALMLVIIGAVPALLTPVFIALPVMMIFAALNLFGIYRKHVKMRPVFVTVRDDGLVLEFRSGRERFIHWSDIRDVYAGPSSEAGFWKNVRSGAFRINCQRTPYLITHDISSALVERYTKAMSQSPVKWNGQVSQ